jgi:hypothetical protein
MSATHGRRQPRENRVVPTGFRTELLYGCRRVLTRWFDDAGVERAPSAGTGFIVDFNGRPLLITNRHVLDPAYRARDRSGWRHGPISLVGTEVIDGQAATQFLATDDATIAYGDSSADIAVVDVNSGTCTGDLLPGGSLQPISSFFAYETLADESWLTGSLEPGRPVYVVGFPRILNSQTTLPLVLGGIVASDPRLRYPIRHKDGSEPEPEDVLLLHSGSWYGLSGSPVIAVGPPGRPGALVGINAGRVDDSGNELTYAYKSTAILATINQLRT